MNFIFIILLLITRLFILYNMYTIMQNNFHIIIVFLIFHSLNFVPHPRWLLMMLHSKSKFISNSNKAVVSFYVQVPRVHETAYAHLYNA